MSFGALLFLVSLALQLIQLFEEASARSAANQAPPESFTPANIAWRAAVIAVLLLLCILLNRFQHGRLHMGRSRFYALCGLLTVFLGGVRFVDAFLEILIYPEFINVLDCLSIAVCVIAPVLMLLVADWNNVPPDDNVLLFLGIGGIGFSVISTLTISIVLRAGYTLWRLVPELLFRAGLILYGVAALQKAFALRASYPLVSVDEPAPRRIQRRPASDEPFALQLDGEQAPRQSHATPRAQYDAHPTARTHADETLRTRAQDEGLDARADAARSSQPPRSQALWQTGRVIVSGGTGRIPTQDPGSVPSERQTCPYCGKRMPAGFPNCPRCGRDM